LVGGIKSLGRSAALIFQRQKFWKIYLSLRRVTYENALTESEDGRPRLVVEAYGRVISNLLSLQASSMSIDSHRSIPAGNDYIVRLSIEDGAHSFVIESQTESVLFSKSRDSNFSIRGV